MEGDPGVKLKEEMTLFAVIAPEDEVLVSQEKMPEKSPGGSQAS